jgi:hypothetical protein
MEKFFNTTGPCDPDRHYMLPPKERLVNAQLEKYISGQLYWVLHAPRQTGKTTFLLSYMKEINESGEGFACYVSLERAQGLDDIERAMPEICEAVKEYAELFLGEEMVPNFSNRETPGSMLSSIMISWAKLAAPKPLIVLFDEVDVLKDQAMISFLRQLRGGFVGRGIGTFPVSIALVGMRDLRDYLIQSKNGKTVNQGSPFNIKEDSVVIGNFYRNDVFTLARQHVDATGQQFTDEALELVWEETKGQPWLVNALLKKCTWNLCPHGETVAIEHVRQAREMLIQERAVHLDSLQERLKDPRIQKIVQVILTGESDPDIAEGDDFLLAQDMGLVTVENGTPSIANPIYREIIARVLSYGMQLAIPAPEFKWKNDDGTLDMMALFREFQKFWRRHSDIWEEKSDYTEAFPHLLLMAFLQRVANGGGRIEREYAAGRGRVDVAVEYGGVWSIIEIKLVHPYDGFDPTKEEGLVQINRYREKFGTGTPCYLVIFDRTPAGREKPWDERLSWEVVETDAGRVIVIGG